mgnify:CR=1 FL=1
MKKSITLISIVLLLSISFVLAAGSSSGGTPSRNSDSPAQIVVSGRTTCEDIEAIRERIKCRFQYKAVARAEAADVVEEACRGRAGAINEDKCKALYERLKNKKCYDFEDPVAKKRCLLKESGININTGGTFRAAPNDVKRSYVVALLYELQERIEKLEANGEITVDESASLVAKIVEIKQMILDGKPRSEIVPKIQAFKAEFRATITEDEQ